jgi:hypothetical protein
VGVSELDSDRWDREAGHTRDCLLQPIVAGVLRGAIAIDEYCHQCLLKKVTRVIVAQDGLERNLR